MKRQWVREIRKYCEYKKLLPIKSGQSLFDKLLEEQAALHKFTGGGNRIVALCSWRTFQRVKSEMMLMGDADESTGYYSLHIDLMRMYRNQSTLDKQVEIYLIGPKIKIPRALELKDLTQRDLLIITQVLEWMEDGQRKGKPFEEMLYMANLRFVKNLKPLVEARDADRIFEEMEDT